MRELLKELCALNGVSGDEGAVRDFIRAQAEPYADSIRTDALGNLIVFKKGKKPTGNLFVIAILNLLRYNKAEWYFIKMG